MRFYGITNVGMQRKINEDVISFPKKSDDVKVFLLADGMGGANAGEIASKIAIETCKKYFEDNIELIPNESDKIQKLISNAMIEANLKVIELSKSDEKYKGMGTTLIILYIYKNKVYIGNIGDSRVYRVRRNIIRQLTKDHSYVQELVNSGMITREEAKDHPQKNVLTKVIGYENDIKPDIITKGFLKDDVILMCSDGLSNMLENSKIFDIVTKNIFDVNNMAKILVEEANKAGGLDNISVITISND